MRWEYESGHGGLLYIRLTEGKVGGTIPLDDNTLVDVADDGHILGIEILNGEERLPYLKYYPKGAIEAEPEPLQTFFIIRNDKADRQLLFSFVQHVVNILSSLTAGFTKYDTRV